MKIKGKIISALTAGLCAFSLLSGTAPLISLSAFAEDIEYTFDGQHELTDEVFYSDFATDNKTEVQEKLLEVFERACGKDYDKITYGDLKKITSLNLSKMELTDIPLCIKYMVNLRSLDLSHNDLQNEYNVPSLNLSELKKLKTLDVSYNYLTKVPSWYVLDGIDKKYIDHNLLPGDDQRSIKAQTPVYYFMDGEGIYIDELKEKILADICFDNGAALPEFLYDPDDSSDEQPLRIVTDDNGDTPLDAYVNEDGKFELPGDVNYTSAAITVRLFDNENNANTKTEIKIFLLDGSSPTTAKARLETLLGEVENLDKTLYTSGSFANFENAQKTAKAIFDYPNSDAEMLKTALEQLDVAKNSLILGIDDKTKTVLTELSAVGKTYKEEDYSPSSWESLQKALDKITAIAADANATLSSAKTAILSFQNAQKGLEKTRLDVPSVIPKSDFEAIFGENKTVSAKGSTRSGRTYEWKFPGTKVTAPADFNPEITDAPSGEDAIMLESGRAGGYFAFSTTQSGAFAGTGTLTVNVSDKLGDGAYYYYKWNSSGSLIGEVSVKNGSLSVDVSEGGTYYISNVLQRFELVSDKLEIDFAKRSIIVPLCPGYNAANFKNLFKYGSSVSVYDADGKPVSSSSRVKTGMKASSPKGEEYTVTVMGDVNDDGYVNAKDALEILKYFVSGGGAPGGEDKTDTQNVNGNPEANVPQKQFGIGATGINVADVNGDGFMNAKDSLLILKAFIG